MESYSDHARIKEDLIIGNGVVLRSCTNESGHHKGNGVVLISCMNEKNFIIGKSVVLRYSKYE